MNTEFSPRRSDAIRSMLVARASLRPAHGRRIWGAALLVSGALVGAGVSTAAFAVTGGFGPGASVAAPDPAAGTSQGVAPGAPVITNIGAPVIFAAAHDEEFALDRPSGATHVRVTLVPTAAGTLSWGTDPDGNNPSVHVTADELKTGAVTTWTDIPLSARGEMLSVRPSAGAAATVTVQYLNYVPTHLGVNDSGQTYGVDGGPDGAPDLVLVTGTAPDGRQIEGYARRTDLEAFSPEHPEHPNSPEEALRLQSERDAEHPDGWDVPIFQSDGVTRIGTFHIG